jgi:hypothetical protein
MRTLVRAEVKMREKPVGHVQFSSFDIDADSLHSFYETQSWVLDGLEGGA